jgi:sialic acid synthase SpsE
MKFGPFDQRIQIGSHLIGQGLPSFIIGEIGSNHNRSLTVAKKMIDIGADAGLDAVKFQNLRFEKQYVIDQRLNGVRKIHQKIDVEDRFFKEVSAYTLKRGLIFLSTATFPEAVEFLDRLLMPAFKVASPITFGFSHLVLQMAKTKKPILVSTGFCEQKDIDRAICAVMQAKNRKCILLHCTSSYPTPSNQIFFRFIADLRKRYGCLVGFSDHSMSKSLPAVAVALGANVIEKHFTLSRKMNGPDHAFALEPDELREMVRNIRDTEAAMNGTRKLVPAELKNRRLFMAKVVAAHEIALGAVVKEDDIIFRRAPGGIEEYEAERYIIGKKTKRIISAMQLILRGDVI